MARKSKINKSELQKLFFDHTEQEIANYYGCTLYNIKYHRKKFGLIKKRKVVQNG
jgi:hypothetical protein